MSYYCYHGERTIENQEKGTIPKSDLLRFNDQNNFFDLNVEIPNF